MKRSTFLILAAVLIATPLLAKGRSGSSASRANRSVPSNGHVTHERVSGYTKKNGTHVAPHDRSVANSTKADNWTTKGNVNPDTGKRGTKRLK